jgi:hypothetical protein
VGTTAIERKAAIKSIVVRFCTNLFIKNRQNQNLRISFCVFTQPRPLVATAGTQMIACYRTLAESGALIIGRSRKQGDFT